MFTQVTTGLGAMHARELDAENRDRLAGLVKSTRVMVFFACGLELCGNRAEAVQDTVGDSDGMTWLAWYLGPGFAARGGSKAAAV